MLIFLFVAAALNLNAFSAPVTASIDTLNPNPPLIILGRDIPIPECVNPARYRTIQQIILSCLATIFACTWASLHPNVPDPHNSGWQNFMMRMRTMFWALIGPEFIMIWAFRQRKAAAEHVKAYNQKFKLTPKSHYKWQNTIAWFHRTEEGKDADPAWNLTQGFLLEMHGLVTFRNGQRFSLSRGLIPPFLPTNLSRMYNSFVGRCSCILDTSQLSGRFNMSEGEIKDKSKGSFFTKLIVVIQTSWFILQCIARWSQKLYVTELEIVTLAFAVLNVITCVLWWDKPQDMRVAIPVFEKCKGCGAVVGKVDERDTANGHPRTEHASLRDNRSPMEEQALLSTEEQNRRDQSHTNPPVVHSESLWSELCYIMWTLPRALWMFIKAINPFPAYRVMIGDDLEFGTSEVRAAFYSSTEGTSRENAVALAISLIGVLFGGVHMLPIWLSDFPSTAEKYLWIGSTIFLLIEPALVSIGMTINLWLWRRFRFSSDFERKFAFLIFFPHTTGFLLYAIARMILIVLACISLRSLPPNAFSNLEWSTFFPHI